MARYTLDSVQSRVASIVDQDESTSAISTDDYSLRREYINMAQQEWAESYDWQVLYKEDNSVISTSTGNASVALPADFRKMAVEPRITYDGTNTENFPEIRPQETKLYASTDRYVYVLGNESDGKTMFVNAGTLASGASIKLGYYSSPASLASPVDVAMCPNPEYLVQRTLAFIWESQSDPRFPQAKVEADKILKNLLEHEQTPGEGQDNRVLTVERTEFDSFRWGKS